MERLWELCEDSVSPQRRFRAAPSRPLKNQTRAMARENRLGIPLAANVLQRGPKGERSLLHVNSRPSQPASSPVFLRVYLGSSTTG